MRAVVAMFLILACSGCVDDSGGGPSNDLGRVERVDGVDLLVEPAIISLAAGKEDLTIEATMTGTTSAGPDLPPMPGMGGDIDVSFDAVPVTSRVTQSATSHVEWHILPGLPANASIPTDLADRAGQGLLLPGDESYQWQADAPGPYMVLARFVDDGQTIAWTGVPNVLVFHGQITLTGDVWPVGSSDPASPEYASMADRFSIETVAPPVAIEAQAMQSAGLPAHPGWDIDLGLYQPDGRPIACSANNAAAAVPLTPASSSESIVIQDAAEFAVTASFVLWVGAQQDGCTRVDGSGGSFVYANAAPVPYEVALSFTYDAPR